MNRLVMHHTPDHIDIGLVTAHTLYTQRILPRQANARLLLTIDELCTQANLTLTQLSYCAVNIGPGSATTLRTMIATAQGLSYATGLALVAVNGIEAFVHEYHQTIYTHTYALFDAFGSDIYYALYDHQQQTMISGCASIESWLHEKLYKFLNEHPHARIRFIGNGCIKHAAAIAQLFSADIINKETTPLYGSLEAIALQAHTSWQTGQGITKQLTSLYLRPYIPS